MKTYFTLIILLLITIRVEAQLNFSIKLNENFGKDARIDSRTSQANLNFGNSNSLGIWTWTISGGLSINRTLLSIPISHIPTDAIIQNARLKLFHDTNSPFSMGQSGDNSFTVRRITGKWKEDSVTWNNQPTVTNLNQYNYIFNISQSNPDVELTITNLLLAARDNGDSSLNIMLQLNTEQMFRSLIFASSEHPDSTKRPRLDIQFGLPEVNLIRPTLLDSHQINTPLIIEWNSLGVENVSIDFSLDNTQWFNIASNVPSKSVNNIFTWTPSFTAPACKIRVRSYSKSNIFDISDQAFKIVVGPSINYLTPISGSILNAGMENQITWQANKIPFVKLSYSTDNQNFQLIDSNIIGSLGKYIWQAPMIKSDSLIIRITAQNNPLVFTQNNQFVKIWPLPVFQIIDPNQTQNWIAGTSQTLSWSYSNNHFTRLYYAQEGGPWQLIKDSIYLDSTFTWNLPPSLIGKIKLRVCDAGQRVYGDTTPFFINIESPIIKDSIKINLIFPTGGEIFDAGQEINIQWTSSEVDSVKLQLKNGTQEWMYISPALPASLSSYLYKIPSMNETINYIKIIGHHKDIKLTDSNTIPFAIKKSETGFVEIFSNELQVYPNPINGNYLWIKDNLRMDNAKKIRIYSLKGEFIKSEVLNANKYISVADLENGTYMLYIETEKFSTLIRQIIVKK